ncbi:MAG: enoyl-CoA hydratase-related protein [Actinomycetota bacterium]|jgi:enoyl-CoA hydratase/carnithine racemase|nr:enoyl-CoA hydratase-related protein [Actinomycetota bacterium]MEC7667048.1 enoyl-CoA hydratase-related protein [Actinomycetota bacterium]MEC8464471.1 enoyl-CoA hydratase-related protein [Actinomycetota bacterium]MEC8502568.1 enoyl-CoA hydratase-related protein [Actinomycetota bacterium]MEC8520983.1 enoyl-CoA hydratase-related protein [Actinomycetota bacterium]
MYDTIIYEVDNPVATITLNRPEAMNAWTNRMDREIRDAVSRASGDPAVVGIIITGAGRAFCAGADMNLLSNISSGDESSNDAGSALAEGEAAADSNGDFDGRFPFLMTTPKPIIAAINGAVAGMAFPFSLCCDLRVGTEKSLFLTAFAQRGLIAEWGLGWLLPKLVGPSVALDLLMSSRRVTGVEGKELGLLNHIVDNPDDLLPWCRNYITELAEKCSPTSMAIMKQQVYEHLHQGMGAAESEAAKLMVESFGRPDFAEGVQSFVEKRPPSFSRIGDN